MDVRVGQVWQRKDPRDGGRQVEVTAVNDHFVTVKAVRASRIRAGRFPSDYVLVKDVEL